MSRVLRREVDLVTWELKYDYIKRFVMRKRYFLLLLSVMLVLLVSACGGSSQGGTPTDQAQGSTDQLLATGKLVRLPSGILYINVMNVSQAAGNKITHKHVAGFVYVVAGTQTLTTVGGDTLTLQAGQAGFIGDGILHTHINPASTANDWYFISVRPTTARKAPPFAPSVKVLYATPDLPTLAPGAYNETLRMMNLQPGGRGSAHKNTGVEVFIVLEGSISLHIAGQSPNTLTQEQGSYSLPNTGVQEFNTGNSVARILIFEVGPAGQAFQTHLDQSP